MFKNRFLTQNLNDFIQWDVKTFSISKVFIIPQRLNLLNFTSNVSESWSQNLFMTRGNKLHT